MPLFDLLVTKIQGWRDHRASRREDFQNKVEAGVTDIRALLIQARLRRISYRKEYRRHTRGFMSRAQRLALGSSGHAANRETRFSHVGCARVSATSASPALPHLDHRHHLQFRARQPGPTTHLRAAAAASLALSPCHEYYVLFLSCPCSGLLS
jgi:hypothetical protein